MGKNHVHMKIEFVVLNGFKAAMKSYFLRERLKGVALICGTADRGTAEPAEPVEPAEPREITSFFSFATYIPGIRLQLISLLCINPDFVYFLT